MADNKEKQDRLKALDAAISQIEKQYGRGSVMKLAGWTSQGKNRRDLWTGIFR